MNKFEAKLIMEALRSGIASRRLSRIFAYGREGLLERIDRDLTRVATDGDSSSGLVIKGDYGEGKTHLLNVIFNRATAANFAVSFVALSKETPFNRVDKLYRRVVDGTHLPGAAESGFESVLRTLKPDSPEVRTLLNYAEADLHPKLCYVLQNYFEAADFYQRYLLYSDLAGNFLPAAKLKAFHRLNFNAPAKFERFGREAHFDYFRLLSFLFKQRGYAGWVILFDEFELVGKLGTVGRAGAYLNAGRFLFSAAQSLTATHTVFSVASSFWPMVLLKERRADVDEIPDKLRAKGQMEEAVVVRRVLNHLLQEPVTLEALPTAEVRRLLQEIKHIHGAAYQWPAARVDLDAVVRRVPHGGPLRYTIRAVVEHLDFEWERFNHSTTQPLN